MHTQNNILCLLQKISTAENKAFVTIPRNILCSVSTMGHIFCSRGSFLNVMKVRWEKYAKRGERQSGGACMQSVGLKLSFTFIYSLQPVVGLTTPDCLETQSEKMRGEIFLECHLPRFSIGTFTKQCLGNRRRNILSGGTIRGD